MRLRLALVSLALLASSTTVELAGACAACRNPSMPIVRGNEGALGTHAWRFNASLSGTALHVIHEAGCADLADCDEVPVQPEFLHDQRIYPFELRLSTEYGFSPLFGLEVQLPLRLVSTTIEYTTLEGEPYEPLDPDVHHRDETLVGLVDPWVLARFATKGERYFLAARPGVSVPFGRTEEDPYELGDVGEEHQHIQFGTGTFDPVLVLEGSRHFEALDLSAFAQGQASLYENKHGYRAPWKVMGGANVIAPIVKRKLSLSLGPQFVHESEEEWDGEVQQDGNLGRTEISIASALTLTVEKTAFTLTAYVPVWRHLVEGDEPQGTLQSPLALSLSVVRVFDGHGRNESGP